MNEKLQPHLDYADKLYGGRIIGIFLRGSQNYELDTKDSDIDTLVLVMPTFEEIALNEKQISKTHTLPNGEQITVKDIRLFMREVMKLNPSALEPLFTRYYFIEETYASLWEQMIRTLSGLVPYCNIGLFCNVIGGILHQKEDKIFEGSEGRQGVIEEYGYDPKQLHHLLRYAFLLRYVAESYNYPCAQIFNDCDRRFLVNIKQCTPVRTKHEVEKLIDMAWVGYEAGCQALKDRNPTQIDIKEIIDSFLLKFFEIWAENLKEE